MQGLVALEEHMAIDETLGDSKQFMPHVWDELRGRLLDVHGKRLALMDKHGIEMMIMSLNSPAIQSIPSAKRAAEIARKANDALAEEVRKRPDRFAAFCALPLQDPELAIQELTRCMKELGFKGANVNGFSQVTEGDSVVYLDLPQYLPFWAELESLDAPFYLHPRDPLPSRSQHYEGHPWFLGPTWAFAVETAIHALRLMAVGLFDKHPRLKIILGHLGEGLPYNMWRLDHRLRINSRGMPAKKPMSEYFRTNFYLTTSGNLRTQTLLDALLEIGSDHLMFATDYPFEDVGLAADWLATTSISDNDRLKIGRLNAINLFKLNLSR
jgi:predicted TIM-barrel fold metal-dependent hydrolase